MPTAVSESEDSMRFLLRFVGERIAGDCEEDSSVAEATLLEAMEDCIDNIDRLLRRADDEPAKGIPAFCRALVRLIFEV